MRASEEERFVSGADKLATTAAWAAIPPPGRAIHAGRAGWARRDGSNIRPGLQEIGQQPSRPDHDHEDDREGRNAAGQSLDKSPPDGG